jgi:hypothetical protein
MTALGSPETASAARIASPSLQATTFRCPIAPFRSRTAHSGMSATLSAMRGTATGWRVEDPALRGYKLLVHDPDSCFVDPAPRLSMPQSAMLIPASAVLMPQSAMLIPTSAVLIPESAVLIPASAVLFPESAMLIPASALRTPKTALRTSETGLREPVARPEVSEFCTRVRAAGPSDPAAGPSAAGRLMALDRGYFFAGP